ncbi:MAG: hypothetical protein ABIM89_05700, partial [Mycobacteriales bacterium]
VRRQAVLLNVTVQGLHVTQGASLRRKAQLRQGLVASSMNTIDIKRPALRDTALRDSRDIPALTA